MFQLFLLITSLKFDWEIEETKVYKSFYMKCVNEGELSRLLNIPFGFGININKRWMLFNLKNLEET